MASVGVSEATAVWLSFRSASLKLICAVTLLRSDEPVSDDSMSEAEPIDRIGASFAPVTTKVTGCVDVAPLMSWTVTA